MSTYASRKLPVASRKRAKADGDLPKKVIQLAQAMGFMAWRANSGSVKTEAGHWVKLSEPGTPDCLMLPPDGSGRLIGVECKSATGTLSESQKLWHQRARDKGAIVLTVRSLPEAQQKLRLLLRSSPPQK